MAASFYAIMCQDVGKSFAMASFSCYNEENHRKGDPQNDKKRAD